MANLQKFIKLNYLQQQTMDALQKFKLLATQCAVAGSPTRSPTTSPIIHLYRRRSAVHMLLSRNGEGCGGGRKLPQRRRRSTLLMLLSRNGGGCGCGRKLLPHREVGS
ncbi:Uncharacterized protein Fot_19450 [Forsythia ovata]|uniref:Uncharacterized protein n=1 Tax=Forsythia ovata TaxID=205694 RepID=A0ABD1VL37_9LAMI